VIVWRQRALTLLALLVVALEVRASDFEYLYVEANTGSSAGGHFALRLDDWVYDFQNAELGTLRMRRTDYQAFRYLYTVLENRTMHIAGIDVPHETREAIFDRFNRRYLIQNSYFSLLESLRGDRELIRRLLARDDDVRSSESGRATPPEGGAAAIAQNQWYEVRIRGAGFFYDGHLKSAEGDSASLRDRLVGESAPLRALRDRLESDQGKTYLKNQIAALERAAENLSPSIEAGSTVVDRDSQPESSYHFSDRYQDLGAKIVALRALENATPIQPSARIVPSGDEYELSDAERSQVRAFAERLEDHLARLVTSKRPDWGYSLLLGMARLQTLSESLEVGRWVVLDSVPETPAFHSQRAVRRRAPYIIELDERASAAFLEARTHFATTPEPGEPALAWLEESINRHAAFQHGFALNLAIPRYEGGLLPDRMATPPGLPLPEVDLQTLRRAAEIAKTRERAHLNALKQTFGYQLVSNNCVTEIFATLNEKWDPAEAGTRTQKDDDPERLLDFIPVVAYRKVLAAHADAETSEIPSYRRVRLEAMYEGENDLGVYLRESNTLTSTIYRRNDLEPFFLFFTEDALPLRPVYGILNFTTGIGEMLLGVLRAPWDRGRMFTSGLKGAAYSLPELLFVNLRKGILEYAPGKTPRTRRRPIQRAAVES